MTIGMSNFNIKRFLVYMNNCVDDLAVFEGLFSNSTIFLTFKTLLRPCYKHYLI